MTFSEAIEALKNGKKVARTGWNGKGMYLFLLDGEKLRGALDGEYEECVMLPTIAMYTHNSTGRTAILFGWLASQSDMLGNDWTIVE